MWHLVGPLFVKAVFYVMPQLLRRFYPAAKLATLVALRIREDGDGIVLNGGDPPVIIARRFGQNVTPNAI